MNVKSYKRNICKRDTEYLLEEFGALWYRYFEEPCEDCETKMEIVKDEILRRTGELKNDNK